MKRLAQKLRHHKTRLINNLNSVLVSSHPLEILVSSICESSHRAEIQNAINGCIQGFAGVTIPRDVRVEMIGCGACPVF
jgi:hypothetical protein